MGRTNATLAVLMASAAGFSMVNEANSGAFALREQSAVFQGTSFAGYGTVVDSLSSMFWNPATVVGHEGIQGESVNSFIIPRGDISTDSAILDVQVGAIPAGTPLSSVPGGSAGEAGDVGQSAWLPATYGSYQVNDQFYLGLATNSPFGLATKPEINWAGQIYARSSKALSVNVTPIVGVKVNEYVSLGLGMQFQYLQVRLKSAFPSAQQTPGGLLGVFQTSPTAELKGEDHDLGLGATLGILLTPRPGTQIGIGYRSPIKHDLEGELIIPTLSVNGITVPGSQIDINADVILPEQINFSFQQEITPEARIMGTFEWTNWSRFGSFNVFNEAGVVVQTLKFNYNDGYFVSVGGEYDFYENWTGRVGVGYEWSPVDEAIRSARVPDTDRVWLSAGLSYVFNDMFEFDLGYSHLFALSDDINIVPGHQDYEGVSFRGDVDAAVDIVSAAVRYKF
ncbi:transporter [Rhodobacteraceae bacterium RKSG542]|uniref:OmpP1/FadL family transporter n=1 Tax=Pseudovibrio flavus TaxID=2529854 RepID=UPI0012BBB452|nr:OmpP1/FadL family transporter [Pseudovibrio flavus]MTI19228.1 transporter [Pseudovibrio flavus]